VTERMEKKLTPEKFSDNLKRLRKKQNISQESLAALLGTQRAQIWRWENGNGNPTLNSLIEISAILKVKVADLVEQ